MKKLIFLALLIVFSVGIYLLAFVWGKTQEKLDVVQILTKDRPFDKYTIENLSSTELDTGIFSGSQNLLETEKYDSFIFDFSFKPDLSKIKSTTGQINIPKEPGSYPLVIMIRGFVNQEIYKTGDGTKNAAKFFAENGFLTVAPDFLGYGNSDSESGNIFETRFQTYVTTLSLLKSLNDISFTKISQGKWDGKNILIWAHSNGGQIALTTLAITKKEYPTVLWAPVSKPFPYSVLYYTDDSIDTGKFIRKELAKLEESYNTDLYSFTNYFENILAPIQIDQGMADDAIPVSWSNTLTIKLKKTNKNINYNTYSGTDHNMRPKWDEVIANDLVFFKNNIKN